MDLLSDEPWPADVAPALELLDRHRRRSWLRRRAKVTAEIPLRDEAAFAAAVLVVPYSIGSSGFAAGRLPFNADDTGTSTWFELTLAELESVRRALSFAGYDPALLEGAPLPRDQ